MVYKMTEIETVKVELELPGNVWIAARRVCERFDYDLNKLVVEAIEGDLEGSIGRLFGDYMDGEEDEDFAREIDQILEE